MMIRFDIQSFFRREEINDIKLIKIDDFKNKIVVPRRYDNNIDACYYIEIDFNGDESVIIDSLLDWDTIETNKCYGGYIYKLKGEKGYWIYERPKIIDYFKELEEAIAENIRLKSKLYLMKKN